MTISSGPLPVISNQTGDNLPSFRLNQHITAEVLQVNGIQAILVMEGVPIVARLASLDQAAALQTNRLANFIVKDLTGQQLVLQLVQPQTDQTTNPPRTILAQELASSLLEQIGVPLNDKNIILARALLGAGMELTPQVMAELTHSLDQIGNWGDVEARVATALKAAGLPVTEGSLALMLKGNSDAGQSLVNLLTLINNSAQSIHDPRQTELLNKTMAMLQGAIIDWNAPPDKMADSLRQASTLLGQSMEHLLLEHTNHPDQPWPEKSLILLAGLKQAFEQHGNTKLTSAIGSFLEDVRQNHLFNLQPQPLPGQGQWSRLDLALHLAIPTPLGHANEDFQKAHIRIAHDDSSPDHEINPAFTRLVIQVDLEPGSTLQVDLSVVNRQVKAEVTAPDTATGTWAQNELSTLAEGLAGLGYNLQSSKIVIGAVSAQPAPSSTMKAPLVFKTIDLAV